VEVLTKIGSFAGGMRITKYCLSSRSTNSNFSFAINVIFCKNFFKESLIANCNLSTLFPYCFKSRPNPKILESSFMPMNNRPPS